MTTITTTPVALGVRDEATASPIQRVLEWLSALREDFRFYRKDRRMRSTLADLSDSQLLDIGIGEHEISRVRSFDRFTPQAWSDPEGRARYV